MPDPLTTPERVILGVLIVLLVISVVVGLR